MITRYVPLGLLLMLIFLSCKTAEVEDTESSVKDQKSSVEVEESSVEELVELYGDDYRGLILALEELRSPPWELISRLYFAIGELEKAISTIKKDPEFMSKSNLLEVLCMIEYSRKGVYHIYLEKLYVLDPTNVLAINIKGEELYLKDDLEGAETLLLTLDTVNFSSKTAMLLGDICLRRVDILGLRDKRVLSDSEDQIVTSLYKKALKYYKYVEDSRSALYYNKLAEINRKLGNDLDQLRALEKAGELDPTDPWIFYDMGKIYFYLDSYDKALENLHKAHTLEPEHFFTNVFLGRTYYNLKEFGRAYGFYSTVLQQRPDYYPAYLDMSIILTLKGESTLAFEMIKSYYIKSKTRDPFVTLYLVNSYMDHGLITEGRKILQKLVKYENNSTILGVYKYILNPQSVGDSVLNDVIIMDDSYSRNRLSFYVAEIMKREGITSLADALYLDVADSGVGFESILAQFRLSNKS